MDGTDRTLDRRTFLRAAGVAGATAVAGLGSARRSSVCETTEFEGRLSGNGDSAAHTYTPETSTVRIDLSGPSDTDLDLYATLDGRTPSTDDYDRKSTGDGASETIQVEEDLDDGAEVGIAVVNYSGGGQYVVTVQECPEAGDEISTTSSGPDLSLSDVRLVQVVDDTRVVKNGSTVRRASNPDPVAGEYTAVLFDVEGDLDGVGDHAVVTVLREDGRGTHADSFRIRWGLLNRVVNKSAEIRSVMHRLAHNADDSNRPPVFRIREDTEAVTVTIAAAGASTPVDAVTLEAGPDFQVRSIPPIKVGFVPVQDPDHGDNYGDGQGKCLAYTESVNNAIEYMRRVYPGDLVTYRHHTAIGGTDDAYEDMKKAWDRLDTTRRFSSFPDAGELRSFTASRDEARRQVREHGFDVSLMITPGNKLLNFGCKDYFSHHFDRDLFGLAPGARRHAVGSLESGGVSSLDVISTITAAHEGAHGLVPDPYEGPGSHPYAQRDDTESDLSLDGQPVDTDHARHRGSDLDDDGTDDEPGVVSVAVDLTDGTYSLVEGFSIGGGEFSSHGPRTSLFWLAASDWPSYMSYTWKKKWADARITQGIIDGMDARSSMETRTFGRQSR